MIRRIGGSTRCNRARSRARRRRTKQLDELRPHPGDPLPSPIEELVNNLKVADDRDYGRRPAYRSFKVKSHYVLQKLVRFYGFKLLYTEYNYAFVEPPKGWTRKKTKRIINKTCLAAKNKGKFW